MGVAERNTVSHGLPYRYIIKKIVTKKRGVEHDGMRAATIFYTVRKLKQGVKRL